MSDTPLQIDRRVTLKWLFAAMAASGAPLKGAYAAVPAAWPEGAVPPVAATGYGTDPPLLEPVLPWPRTLTAEQLRTAAAVCDTILPAEGSWPAPTAVGVHEFVDEWISAPYPEQVRDRPVVLNGFAWLDGEAQARHGKGFAGLGQEERSAILMAATKLPKGAAFVERMKFLTTGAYYTSETGVEELGYVGNVALEGDYPGPTPEALAHLDQILAGLNLKRR